MKLFCFIMILIAIVLSLFSFVSCGNCKKKLDVEDIIKMLKESTEIELPNTTLIVKEVKKIKKGK